MRVSNSWMCRRRRWASLSTGPGPAMDGLLDEGSGELLYEKKANESGDSWACDPHPSSTSIPVTWNRSARVTDGLKGRRLSVGGRGVARRAVDRRAVDRRAVDRRAVDRRAV